MSDILTHNMVSLLPITMEDTELIIRWRNNPNVQRNFVFREHFTDEMHINWMNNMVLAGKVVQFIIQDNASQKKIGSVYLRDIDKQFRSAEYGIFIGEDDYRGKGFGSESAKIIVNYGFHVMKLHRIFLRVLKSNAIAVSSYKKAGFEVEGIARDMVYLDGSYHDIIFMSMINEEVSE